MTKYNNELQKETITHYFYEVMFNMKLTLILILMLSICNHTQ